MGWEQILPAIIGLLGGSLAGGSGKDPQYLTADQAEMQSLMKQILSSQYGEYNYNSPLRQHITQTADWLLPKQSVMKSETPEYNGMNIDPTGPHGPGSPTYKTHPTPTGPTGPTGPSDPTDPTGPTDPGGTDPSDPTNRQQPRVMAGDASTPPAGITPQAMNYLASYLARNGVRG